MMNDEAVMPCQTSTPPFCLFFNDTATTEIYTLSLHDALPIFAPPPARADTEVDLALVIAVDISYSMDVDELALQRQGFAEDRKSTRLNSSHANISYAVFCLKKKKKKIDFTIRPHCQ